MSCSFMTPIIFLGEKRKLFKFHRFDPCTFDRLGQKHFEVTGSKFIFKNLVYRRLHKQNVHFSNMKSYISNHF